MRIITAPRFFRIFVHPGYSAFAFFPFVFVRSATIGNNAKVIRHEKIHLAQQLELGVVLFYPIYLLEFLFWLVIERNGNRAYRRISFEREAYENDGDVQYLHTRKSYAMWKKS